MSARKTRKNDEKVEQALLTAFVRHQFVRGDGRGQAGPYSCDVWCRVCRLPELCVGYRAARKMVDGTFKGKAHDQQTNEVWMEVCNGQ